MNQIVHLEGKVVRARKDKIMSSIEEVRKIMGFGDNFHMCDVSEVAEDHIHLESWDEDVPNTDFEAVAERIANDGYDISGFELLEIPHPKVFCFGKQDTDEYFDVVNFYGDGWHIAYIKDSNNVIAECIEEA